MINLLDNYRGKKVLITGHTGFKGSWLSLWLKKLGAEVIGYALDPYTEKDNFVLCRLSERLVDVRHDIRDFKKFKEVLDMYAPEFVFHLAAQSLVGDSYVNPKDTFDINIGGTVNVLESCRQSESVKVIVIVTSDKCYVNKEWVWGYRENDELGGYDPYSSSKACSELITRAYKTAFFNQQDSKRQEKTLSSTRAGNVIGGGDWREDRIIPDCIRYLEKEEPIQVRNPFATRPWQFVLEPLGGYLLLGAKMCIEPQNYCGAWNFGPEFDSHVTVKELVEILLERYGKGSWQQIQSQNGKEKKETRYLSLDISKAKSILRWKPLLLVEDAIEKTVDWYKNYQKNVNMYEFCNEQISSYMDIWLKDENHRKRNRRRF